MDSLFGARIFANSVKIKEQFIMTVTIQSIDNVPSKCTCLMSRARHEVCFWFQVITKIPYILGYKTINFELFLVIFFSICFFFNLIYAWVVNDYNFLFVSFSHI